MDWNAFLTELRALALDLVEAVGLDPVTADALLWALFVLLPLWIFVRLGGAARREFPEADEMQTPLSTREQELSAGESPEPPPVETIGPAAAEPAAASVEPQTPEIEPQASPPAEAPRAAPEPEDAAIAAPPAATPAQPATLSTRLSRTRQGFFSRIKQIFGAAEKIDQETLEQVEAELIACDLGVHTVQRLMQRVKARVREDGGLAEREFRELIRAEIETVLTENTAPQASPASTESPFVIMIVGVNGVGKTTTTAKLAARYAAEGKKVLLAAADTFRAAAVQQLEQWGERVGVPVVKGAAEAKPATVVFEAMKRACDEQYQILIIDTAGRLNTKTSLMQELAGVRNAMQRHLASAPHETLLVVDGSTGMNALSQAQDFNEAVPLTGLIVTKLDGTPKGGVVVAINEQLRIPVRYIGVGEDVNDLRPFDPHQFSEALFDEQGLAPEAGGDGLSAHARKRRRRREGDLVEQAQ